MIKIAIVEDGEEEANLLLSYLEQFSRENGETFLYKRFKDAASFLEEKGSYDIIFMDIMLPNITGMEAAERLRRYNTRSVIIFVTSMAQFAVRGYEVDALDYIVKPVTYSRLTFKLRRAIDIINANQDRMVIVNNPDGLAQISTSEIYFIEVSGHKLSFHTRRGVLTEYGSLGSLEEQLKDSNFMRCNSCYLLNPKYITGVKGMTVTMQDGSELKISQPKRKKFINDLTNWLGQGKR